MVSVSLHAPAHPHWRQLGKWVNRLVWLVLCLFIAVIAAFAVYVRTGHAEVATVLSGSMRPGIHEGDVVLTHKVSVTSLHVGDIIVFHPPGVAPGASKVHRIATLKQLGNNRIAFSTKGDANKAPDPWGTVTTSGSAYRVFAVVPQVGWLINGGLHWIVIGVLFGLGAMVARWTIKYLRSTGATKGEAG
jgi:signal peptidase